MSAEAPATSRPAEAPPHTESGLSEREVRRGMNINILAGCMGMMWGAATMGVPLTMFMDCLHAGGVAIGLTVTVQQLATLAQIPAALIAERMPTRKRFWGIINITQRLFWVIPACLPFLLGRTMRGGASIVVAVVAASALLSQAGAASWWSWMADLVPARMRGAFWGRRQSVVMCAYLVAVWLWGWILDLYPDPTRKGAALTGFQIVFAAAALLGVADIVIHLWVPEPRRGRDFSAGSIVQRLTVPLRNSNFMRVTVAMGIWTFAVGLVGQYGMLYLKRDFGVSYSQISATTISASISIIVSGVVWGYVIDRLGAKNVGSIAMLLAPAFGIAWFCVKKGNMSIPFIPGWSLPQPVALLLVVNVFAGAFYAAVGLAQVALIGAFAPERGRTVAMAVHWSIVGMLSALGPVLAGKVMDWVTAHPIGWRLPNGQPVAFFHVLVVMQMLITWLIALPILMRVSRQPGEVGVRAAFGMIMVGNPLRAISSIYNIYTLTAAESAPRRARAARRLGEKRTRIAVSDLIEKLDDSSAEVREEAALALGNIAGPAAVGALLRKFNDPESDQMPQIARALRRARSPDSVESLLGHLSDADRETVSEVARALGEIGDVKASGALVELLQGSEDPTLVAAASEALARLGEMAAMYEILPRMIGATNPVLKRSLSVAVADLLGTPGEFYRLVVAEKRAPGLHVSRMLDEIRESVRAATREKLQPEGAHILSLAKRMEEACGEHRHKEAVGLLTELAMAAAALRYGIVFGGDAFVLVESLVWQNERMGVGVWYFALLRDHLTASPSASVDETEILLGLYIMTRAILAALNTSPG